MGHSVDLFLCVKVFHEISGVSEHPKHPTPVMALTGSVATEQWRSQSGRLQDHGDRGIDQSIATVQRVASAS